MNTRLDDVEAAHAEAILYEERQPRKDPPHKDPTRYFYYQGVFLTQIEIAELRQGGA